MPANTVKPRSIHDTSTNIDFQRLLIFLSSKERKKTNSRIGAIEKKMNVNLVKRPIAHMDPMIVERMLLEFLFN